MTRNSALRRGGAGGAVLLAFLLGLFLVVLAVPSRAAAALSFPALTGRVVDQANVLPAATRAELTDKLAQLQAKTSRQLVVVTLTGLQGDDIEDYGYQLGRAWGVGQKGTNNGVLFIVALPNARRESRSATAWSPSSPTLSPA